MSLVVYVGIDKFKAESGAAVREQNATEITLSDIAKWQPNTSEAGTAENQLLVIDTFSEEALALLKNWLKKDTASECIIAWPQPDAWLAASLANGVAGEEALNDWLAQAKRLLALFRSARRQVTLAGYLPGCELKVVKAPLLDRCDNAIYQLAAAYISSQSQALKDTHAYLVASSQECPIEESCETQITQAALSEYHARQTESKQGRRSARALQEADAAQERQQQHIARLKGELSSARDEHALLLQQLQSTQQVVAERTNELQVQRELSKQDAQRLQELEQQLQALKKENEALKQAFENQRKEQGVTQQHNQALKKENEALKQTFETQRKENDATQRHNQVLKKENELLKQTLETQREEQNVTQQNTQSLKKENEALKQAFDSQRKEKEVGQQTLNAVQKESAQLLSTLQQVQQAYESLYIEQQTLSEQLSTVYPQNQQELVKSASDQAYLRRQLEKRQSELNTLRTESEQRIHRLERLVQWLRVHAQRHASTAYRESRSYKKALPKQIAALEASPLFDAEWYCKQYPDVAQANIKPAEHFIKFGAIDGRHPGPLFSTEFYLTHYEDVAASGQHPLLHYLRYGKEENREIHPPQYQLSALQTIAKGAKA
ncbi:hypothetical protein [Vreelandella alkaliphila]|uniref:Uncharacterized protein n=1 Tax=Vreelandella alkaliphila TaxID=272774 RepID=A0AAJ2VPF7_9GAMM|nr:hypothetical protein [Halomonas alkaliphila]MDX5976694.1 hypothetical protein [Halomonas alkaliphila]